MFSLFSHLGHSHSNEAINAMTAIDHCMPIIVGAAAIIAALIIVIVYLLLAWQPKRNVKKPASKKKN